MPESSAARFRARSSEAQFTGTGTFANPVPIWSHLGLNTDRGGSVEGVASKHGGRGVILAPMGSHLLAAALVALTVLPDATPTDCRSAAVDYAAAVASVTDALRTYEVCIGASRGHSQCSAEFDELDGAHREFEDAAAEYRQACPLAPPREPR